MTDSTDSAPTDSTAAADTAFFDSLSPPLRVTTAMTALLRALTDLRLTRAELIAVLCGLLAQTSLASLPASKRAVQGRASAEPLKRRLRQLADGALNAALDMPSSARKLADALAASLRQ